MFVKNLTNKYQANSVACIFMHIISCSFSIAGSSEINSPIISTIAQNIPEKTSNDINTVDSLDLIQSHIDLKTNTNVSSILDKYFIELKTHLTVSCSLELEDYKNYLETRLIHQQNRQKNVTENNLVTELSLRIIKLDTKLKQQEENYKTLFDAKALLDNKLSASLLENKALNNQLSQLNDTCKQISYQDQKQTLAEYLEINKKYTKSLETLSTCEHRVLSDQINFEKNLTILELKIKDEKNNTKVEMQRIIDSLQLEISLKTQQYSNISLQLENKINENEKMIQESIVLKKEQAKKLKAIENEYQLNMTNKQQEVKILENNLEKNLTILELKIKDIIDEKNNTKVEMQRIINSLQLEISLKTQQYSNISLQLENKINENEKMIQESIVLKKEQAKTLKAIENEYQLNLTNKQQEVKIFKEIIFEINTEDNVEIADLWKTLISITKLNEDNIPDDLLQKRQKFFRCIYIYHMCIDNQALVVFYIRKLFDDIALTSNSQFSNKYFCNKKISHYDETICALLSEDVNSYKIDLSYRILVVPPKDIFTGFKNLKTLDLSYTQLYYLESGTFNNLSNLKDLWLQQNHLTSLPKDIFTGLENLESIVLRNNRLHYFDSDIFNNLPKLNSLYIHENNLATDLKNILREKYSLEFFLVL